MYKQDPCVKFQTASNELEDSTDMVKEVLDGRLVLDIRDQMIMDRLYERCANFSYYYEKYYEKKNSQ